MRLSDILNREGRRMSFEVFPPKRDADFESVRLATERIAALGPSFMSVTYGAGGGTSKYTVDIAEDIEKRFSIPTLAHLTCVSSTRATVRAVIDRITEAGIENVMALRGDIPADAECLGEYSHADELVRELRAADLCIGGACYPEGHPESRSAEDDLYYLKRKVDSGCSFLTTQMFFDNSLYYRFVESAENYGITVPIVAGIMPLTNKRQVERAVSLSGSYLPPELIALIERWGDSREDMYLAGIDYAIRQIDGLYSNGVGNLHLYTMNKPEVASSIFHSFFDKVGVR